MTDRPRYDPDGTRLVSLDVVRGLAVTGMILVNHPGDPDHAWPPLAHAAWNGWTVADLVFPLFLFVVGVAVTLSQAAAARRRIDVAIGRRVVGRTLRLFALGLLLNAFPAFDLHGLRIPGVLQRVAICYLTAFVVARRSGPGAQFGLVVLLLAAYAGLMKWVPVPGIGAGVLEPETNVAAWIDGLVLRGHLGRGTWDPEGVLSTLPAVATTLLGVLAGHWLAGGSRSRAEKCAGLVAAGVAGIALGEALDGWLPVNKSLWSSSFAVLSAGTSALTLGVACWLVDVKGRRRAATPLLVFGTNAIVLYVAATAVAKLLDAITLVGADGATASLRAVVYRDAFAAWAGPTAGSVLFAVAFVAVWLAPMTVLWRRGIFVTV